MIYECIKRRPVPKQSRFQKGIYYLKGRFKVVKSNSIEDSKEIIKVSTQNECKSVLVVEAERTPSENTTRESEN